MISLKSMRLNSRLNSGTLLNLLALTTEIHDLFGRLDNSLISASTERQIDGCSCKLIVLRISKSVKSHTDTKSHRHLVTDIDSLNILKDIKTCFS